MAIDPIGTIVVSSLNVIGNKLKNVRKEPYELAGYDAATGKVTLTPNPNITGFAAGVNKQMQKGYEEALSAYIRTGVNPYPNDYALRYLIPFADQYRNQPIEPEPEDDDGSFVGDVGDSEGKAYGGLHLSPIGAEDYFVPGFIRSIPGGAAGFAQQTPAGQRQMFGGSSGGGARRPRRSRKSARKTRSGVARRTPKKRAAARGNRFTKGSAAAKAHMKRLRAMRKK